MLAGGGSRRFGRDKSEELVAGVSLLDRAATTLAEVFPRVVVVASRAPAGVRDAWTIIDDLRPGRGPLGGIEAALTHAVSAGLAGAFVLACDLPLVDTATVGRLVASLPPEAAAAAPGRDGPPGVEPLCAVYRVECLPAVRGALDRDELAVHGVFDDVAGVIVRVAAERLLNVNRPGDAERAEEWLRHHGG